MRLPAQVLLASTCKLSACPAYGSRPQTPLLVVESFVLRLVKFGARDLTPVDRVGNNTLKSTPAQVTLAT